MKTDKQQALGGLGYALSAFGLWGLFPVFFKLVESVNAFEVLAHRVFWSVLILGLVIFLRRRKKTFYPATPAYLQNPVLVFGVYLRQLADLYLGRSAGPRTGNQSRLFY